VKANTRALLERFIRDGVDHALINTDVELSNMDATQIANEIDNRIWLYLDEYFTFEN